MADDFLIKHLTEEMEEGDVLDTRQTIVDEDEHQLLGRINLLISHLDNLNDLIIKTNNLSDSAVKNSTDALQKSMESLTQSLQALTQSQQAVETSIRAEDNSTTAKSQSTTALDNSTTALDNSTTALTNSQQAVEKTNAYEGKNIEQDGRLTAIETDEQAHIEKMNNLEQSILDEAQTRSQQDADIRNEINRLSSSESTLNEEILQRLDTIEKDKLDTTQANIKFSQIDTDIKNINSEQGTQNTRLTEAEKKATEQGNQITGIEGDIDDINTSLATMNNTIIDNNEQFTLFKDEQLLKNNDLDTDIKNINNEQLTQNSRLTEVEKKATEQETKILTAETDITNLKSEQTTQNNKITANETKNTTQDTQISNLQNDAQKTNEQVELLTLALGETQKQVNTLSSVDVGELTENVSKILDKSTYVIQPLKLFGTNQTPFENDTTKKGQFEGYALRMKSGGFNDKQQQSMGGIQMIWGVWSMYPDTTTASDINHVFDIPFYPFKNDKYIAIGSAYHTDANPETYTRCEVYFVEKHPDKCKIRLYSTSGAKAWKAQIFMIGTYDDKDATIH